MSIRMTWDEGRIIMNSDRKMKETQDDAFLMALLAQLEQVIAENEGSYDLGNGLQRFATWMQHNRGEAGKAAGMTGGSLLRLRQPLQSSGDEPLWAVGLRQAGQQSLAVAARAIPLVAPQMTAPTVLRLLLGAQLRRLREVRRISLEDAGHAIRASHSKMNRLELGRIGFKDRDLSDLLTLYGVTGEEEREALRSLARKANAQGWWHDYSDVLPSWFEAYVGLEEASTDIRTYEVQFVPGLLQTEGYARAVTLLGHAKASAEEIERRVGLRTARQALLKGPRPPQLWVVIDEAVLRRPIGERAIMREQLEHLIACAAMPNVTLQVISFQAGSHAAAGGAFSILRFAEPDLPDVVYLEQLTSAMYLDKRETVDTYVAVMERLFLDAYTAEHSAEVINEILGDY
jgi:transcriptional regulator with XRE-family HTH domain